MSFQNQLNTQQEPTQSAVLGVVDSLSQKQPPTNQQVSEVLGQASNFIEQQKQDPRLDAQGLKAITDLQGVILAADQLNQNKNADEKVQKIVTESTLAAQEIQQQGQQHLNRAQQRVDGTQIQGTAEELGQKGKQVGQAALSLLRLMIQSAEFRGFIDNLVGSLQQMLRVQSEENVDQTQQTNLLEGQVQSGTIQIPTQPGAVQIQGQGQFTQSPIQGQPISGQLPSSQGAPLTEAQKHEMSFKFLALLRKANSNEDFSTGVNDVLSLFDELKNQALNNKDIVQDAKQALQKNDHVTAAAQEGQRLVEEFTHRSVEPLLQKTRELFTYVRDNEGARNWFADFTGLVSDSVQKPHLLDEYEFTQRIEKLYDQAYELAQDQQFKAKYTHIFSELRVIAENIKNDPDLNRFQQETQKFLENFTYVDQYGNKQFNTDLVTQMRQLIVPMFINQLDKIPVPPVQGSNEDYDYYFDNLVFSGREIIPEMVEIHTRSDLKVNLQQLQTAHASSRALLKVTNIRPTLSDIHFKFDRKTFPKISDEGTANLRVEGDTGITIRILLELSEVNGAPHFSLLEAFVDIDKLQIDIISAQHDLLIKLFSSLYQTRVKEMIEDNIRIKIKEIFANIEQGVNELFVKYPPSRLKAVISQQPNQVIAAIQS